MMLRFNEQVASPRKLLANVVAPALTAGIREADLVGWYERDTTVGVIFTEIEEARRSLASDTICARVTSLLGSKLPVHDRPCLEISCAPITIAEQEARAALGIAATSGAAGLHLQGAGHLVSGHSQASDHERETANSPEWSRKRSRRTLVSVVVPVFNEEGGIAQLEQRLANISALWSDTFDIEFVFVNDGSSDRTQEQLQAIFGNNPATRLVVHEKNRGIGAAFRTGFDSCKGSIICTIDADCSYGPENLERLVSALEEEAADIAVASPYHPWGEVEGVPRWRIVLSKSCSFLYWVIAPVRLYTYTSVFRAYRRDALDSLRFESDGFVSAAEILVRAAANGSRIVEVPMTLRARTIGYTKMRILRTIAGHLSLIGSLAMYRMQSVRSGSGRLRQKQVPLSISDTD